MLGTALLGLLSASPASSAPLQDPAATVRLLALRQSDDAPLPEVPVLITAYGPPRSELRLEGNGAREIEGVTNAAGEFVFTVDPGTIWLEVKAWPMKAPPDQRSTQLLCSIEESWDCVPTSSPLFRERDPGLVSGETVDWVVRAALAGTASGWVVDMQGRPIAGATVAVWTPSCMTPETFPADDANWLERAITDENGRFTVTGAFHDVHLAARAPGYVDAANAWMSLEGGETVDGVELLVAPSRSVRLRVRRADGQSLGHLYVQACRFPELRRPSYTNTGGVLYSEGPLSRLAVADGEQEAEITLDGLTEEDWTLEVRSFDGGQFGSYNAAPWRGTLGSRESDAEIVLDPGVTIQGRVFRNASRGLQNARLQFWLGMDSWQAGTDHLGNFALAHLPAEAVGTLEIEASGYERWRDRHFRVGSGAPPLVLRPRPESIVVLAGRVVDAEGRAVDAAQVRMEEIAAGGDADWKETRTERNGAFRFEHVQPGSHRLEVRTWQSGFLTQARAVAHTEEPETIVQLGEGVDDLGTLHAKLLDARTGFPMAGYSAWMESPGPLPGSTSWVRGDGSELTWRGLAPGSWRLHVDADGHSGWQGLFEAHAGAVAEVEVRLLPAQPFALQLLDAEDQPIAQARITATLAGAELALSLWRIEGAKVGVRSNRFGEASVFAPLAEVELSIVSGAHNAWIRRVDFAALDPEDRLVLRLPR